MSENIELLPCPFCGESQARMFEPTCRRETPYDPADRLFPVVRCAACYAEAIGENEDYRGTTAIEAWNRRAAPISAAPDMLEALRELSRVVRTYDHNGPFNLVTSAGGYRNSEGKMVNWSMPDLLKQADAAIAKATGEPVELREAS